MEFKTFLEQRNNVSYSLQQCHNAMQQFDFFLKEFSFTEQDYQTTISQKNFQNRSIFADTSDDKFISSRRVDRHMQPASDSSQFLSHVGTEAIRGLLNSFTSLYAHNRIRKNMTEEEIKKNMGNIQGITQPFFSIMEKANTAPLPNVRQVFIGGFFGKDIVANYHEIIVLAAMHNFSHYDQANFIDLIEKVVPDKSLCSSSFLSLFASVLAQEDKSQLVNTILKKVDLNLFAVACLLQDKNHSNFYRGFKIFANNFQAVLEQEHIKDIGQQTFVQSLITNLTNIGMTNNAYYKKNITEDDKNLFSQFFNNHIKNNFSLVNAMINSNRSQNIDYFSLMPIGSITHPVLINSILLNSDKEHIAKIIPLIAPYNQVNLNDLGTILAKNGNEQLSSMINKITPFLDKQQILQMMSSNPKLFTLLEQHYREKKLTDSFNDIVKTPGSTGQKVKMKI